MYLVSIDVISITDLKTAHKGGHQNKEDTKIAGNANTIMKRGVITSTQKYSLTCE